ncbi:MAG TPA: hypothetical protein VJ207_00905 [Thermoplasmata archaeon]|nr:hypothetical protein [Thermoplasmata archaeon]
MNFPDALDRATSLPDVFEIVKLAAEQHVGRTRGGLMLALADLGNHPRGFLGAFYVIASNVIVMNKVPLVRIRDTQPHLYNHYAFHVLLHEYLHALGYVDEARCRQLVYDLSHTLFGEDHAVAQIARDVTRFFPSLVYPDAAWQPADLKLELVANFDRGNTGYIA